MNIIKIENKKYPDMLKNIKNAPYKLYTRGDEEVLNMPCITVVGSRNMSDYGRDMTRKIVKELTLGGMCIVSGLAVGIDTIAHQTCLENNGKTVAVLGSGLNKVFPAENKELFNSIIKSGGCVVSEYEPDTIAQKRFFPERNRIVSGLSLGTLVIEATYRSGTSITAQCALEQGKKVFCIPNSIGNKNSAGIINLLKKGATLVTDGKEIMYELGILDKKENYEELVQKQRLEKIRLLEQEELSQLDEIAVRVYQYIKENKVVNFEIMCKDLEMNVQDINMYLTILELKGLIVNKYGVNYMVRDELYV